MTNAYFTPGLNVAFLRHTEISATDVALIVVSGVEIQSWNENLASLVVLLAHRAQRCCLALRAECLAPGL